MSREPRSSRLRASRAPTVRMSAISLLPSLLRHLLTGTPSHSPSSNAFLPLPLLLPFPPCPPPLPPPLAPFLPPAPASIAARLRLPSLLARSARVTRNAVRIAVVARVMKPTTVEAAMMVDEPEWASMLRSEKGGARGVSERSETGVCGGGGERERGLHYCFGGDGGGCGGG